MKYVRIIDDTYTDVTRSADPNERWDGDDTYTSHSFEGFKVVPNNGYHDLPVLEDAEEMYLLVVHYSTGDSFHQDEGEIEYVGLYLSEDIAYGNEKLLNAFLKAHDDFERQGTDWIKKRTKVKDPGYSVSLLADVGSWYSFYAGAFLGYFENVSDVEVVKLKRKL